MARLRVGRCLAYGGPWLGWELMRRLGLDGFLAKAIPPGREDVPWPMMAAVLVLSRLCGPSSELHIASRSTGTARCRTCWAFPARKINDDRRYRALDALLPHKAELEMHLKGRLGELFDL